MIFVPLTVLILESVHKILEYDLPPKPRVIVGIHSSEQKQLLESLQVS